MNLDEALRRIAVLETAILDANSAVRANEGVDLLYYMEMEVVDGDDVSQQTIKQLIS